MIFRTIIAVGAATLIAVQAVRNAAVTALAETRPTAAAQVWSDHPATELSLGMTEIARATRERKTVPDKAFALINDAAEKEPLASEPFLVRGVSAQLRGDGALAQRAFEAAQWRNPRSLPAAYFLAERYLRSGDSARGLNEVAILARLAPYGTTTVAPYLAGYAAVPANWPRLRQLFRANPALAESVLTTLASNIATAPAVLALADPRQRAVGAPWLPPLLNTLVTGGQYDQARAIWARSSGVPLTAGELVHDPDFRDKSAPPPFNWSLTSSTVGLAERQSGGRLHLVFYGQEDGILASQLLLLKPGSYRLSLQLFGDPARARVLSWSIWCDKADAPLASVTLDAAAARGWRFEVRSGCPAQWLRLSGSSADMPQQSDVTVGALRLERSTSGA